jgi:hypothetical protein
MTIYASFANRSVIGIKSEQCEVAEKFMLLTNNTKKTLYVYRSDFHIVKTFLNIKSLQPRSKIPRMVVLNLKRDSFEGGNFETFVAPPFRVNCSSRRTSQTNAANRRDYVLNGVSGRSRLHCR